MTNQAKDLQKKFRYHHGNLREALLNAAQEILERDGVNALSLRTLARATGVTQAAPYSHFRDKDDLLAAIAERGFQRLALQMAESATGAPSTRIRIEKLVTAYIEFAVTNKPLFRIMFGRELSDMKRFPTLAMTAGKSYALVSAALAGVKNADARFLSVSVWSLCHGLTAMIIDERVKPEQFGADGIAAFVSKNVDIFKEQIG